MRRRTISISRSTEPLPASSSRLSKTSSSESPTGRVVPRGTTGAFSNGLRRAQRTDSFRTPEPQSLFPHTVHGRGPVNHENTKVTKVSKIEFVFFVTSWLAGVKSCESGALHRTVDASL